MALSLGSDISSCHALNASRAACRARCLTRRDNASDGCVGHATGCEASFESEGFWRVTRRPWRAVSRIGRTNYTHFLRCQQLFDRSVDR